MLRYPIHDDELWALTFLKQDTIFVFVNTAFPLCKQFFAAAHELYHIYCYVENADQFCHAQIVTELNRCNADAPIWLREKIGAQKII